MQSPQLLLAFMGLMVVSNLVINWAFFRLS